MDLNGSAGMNRTRASKTDRSRKSRGIVLGIIAAFVTAVLIIHAFAEEPELVAATQRLLDRLSLQYALSSMGLRRVVPFRRQLGRAGRTNIYEDPMTAAMVSWYGDSLMTGDVRNQPCLHHAIVPAAMPYRPGRLVDALVAGQGDMAVVPGCRGLVRIGRGRKSSPEIHFPEEVSGTIQ